MTADVTLARINEGVQLHHGQGQREAARDLFTQMWDESGGERGDPWDQRALAAADLLTDARLARAGVPMSVAALYPSLHLSLAECYRKLGDLDRAREYLQRAQAGIGALGDDQYGQLIEDALDRLTQQLASS
ncbi:hypothetical protein JNW90_07765 [Micromonospora sp. STR1s_5]|nr:hypothetical protein [Micromonospora sp. STR1s_5]